jgi:DHA1 family multidrug resistance protein-like MFS transporter
VEIEMIHFEDPLKEEQEKESSWDSSSPPETAVNTAVPSRAPSVAPKDIKSNSDLTQDDDIEAQPLENPTGPTLKHGCVDATTHIVGWDGPDDPENPMNFPRNKKWTITIVTALITFCVSFSSSVFSTATEVTAVEFGVSLEVMILGVSLYVLGFACGMFFPSHLNL